MTDPVKHVSALTEHLFRHQAGKMVSVLTGIFGTQNLQLVEDVVQDTLIHASQVWVMNGIPDNPSGWLFRVAKNKAIDILRRNKRAVAFDFSGGMAPTDQTADNALYATGPFDEEQLVRDDMLRMMFACCNAGISPENQVTLILKTLCGFSTAEIASAFLVPEETIAKRLYRAKDYFRLNKVKLVIPSRAELAARNESVLHVIYLLFNEGYHSASAASVIRQDVMEEGLHLCHLLTEHPATVHPETYALMALMCFHMARTQGRLSIEGEIVLLDCQNRSTWNHALIKKGNDCMNRAAAGQAVSRYHLEAAIAFEHCTALHYSATDWRKILQYYDWLMQITTSPVVALNRAVAVLKAKGPQAARAAMEPLRAHKKLQSFFLYHAVLGEISKTLDDAAGARDHFTRAIALANTETERKLLQWKVEAIS